MHRLHTEGHPALVGAVPGLPAEQTLGALNVLLRDKDATLHAVIEAAVTRGAEFD
jgi:hypothetical protein